MAQRAAGAAILVMLLVLLLLKQRQAKAIPAVKSSEAKAEGPVRARAPKETSGKAVSFGRARKGKKAAEASTPAAEPKTTSGRMVPRLPAADVSGDPVELTGVGPFDAPADSPTDAHATEATDGMISEPGWPTPGEVWASPDSVNGYGAGEQSWETSATGAGEQDDPLAALTETPELDAAGWATDNLEESLDPATGWPKSQEPAGDDAPVWEKEQAEFDWTETDADTTWSPAEPDDADEASDEISSVQAAWEAPEDDTATWSAEDLWEMPKDEPADEAMPVATAVADEVTVAAWTVPEATVEPVAVEEPTEVDHTPTIIWDRVGELEEIEPETQAGAEVEEVPVVDEAPVEPVAEEIAPEPAAEEVPEAIVNEIVAEPMADVLAPEPVAEEEHPVVNEAPVEPMAQEIAPEPVAETQPPAADEAVAAPVAEAEPVSDHAAEVVASPQTAVTFESIGEDPPLAVVHEEPVVAEEPPAMAEPEIVPIPAADQPEPFRAQEAHGLDAPSLDDDDGFAFDLFEAEEQLVPVGTAFADPAARWASMMPGGSQQPSVDPVSSWSRLQPGSPAVPVGGSPAQGAPHATVAAPQTPAPQTGPATPGFAWWDVPAGTESDPRRGRFALGGYALQSGHQVVSGVTFRDGVVPPPSHWVIGPVVGAVAPGTLVLEVEGCLNCRPQDVEVLMDHGFAPTPDGFSLRLTASETGPFAASGTFTIS